MYVICNQLRRWRTYAIGLTKRADQSEQKMATLQTNSSAHIARASEIITVPKKLEKTRKKKQRSCATNLEKMKKKSRDGGGKPGILE